MKEVTIEQVLTDAKALEGLAFDRATDLGALKEWLPKVERAGRTLRDYLKQRGKIAQKG